MSAKRKYERRQASGMTAYIQHVIDECYAAHHIMIAGGVEPNDIFVGPRMVVNAEPPGVYAVVQARAAGWESKDGYLVFNYYTLVLPTAEHERAFLEQWSAFARAQPSMSKATLDAIVERSQTFHRSKVAILNGLLEKGLGTAPSATQGMVS